VTVSQIAACNRLSDALAEMERCGFVVDAFHVGGALYRELREAFALPWATSATEDHKGCYFAGRPVYTAPYEAEDYVSVQAVTTPEAG
jgi:hypothetical protein